MQEKASNYVKGTKLGDILIQESNKKVTCDFWMES